MRLHRVQPPLVFCNYERGVFQQPTNLGPHGIIERLDRNQPRITTGLTVEAAAIGATASIVAPPPLMVVTGKPISARLTSSSIACCATAVSSAGLQRRSMRHEHPIATPPDPPTAAEGRPSSGRGTGHRVGTVAAMSLQARMDRVVDITRSALPTPSCGSSHRPRREP